MVVKLRGKASLVSSHSAWSNWGVNIVENKKDLGFNFAGEAKKLKVQQVQIIEKLSTHEMLQARDVLEFMDEDYDYSEALAHTLNKYPHLRNKMEGLELYLSNYI